jgi:hypothetical protein
VSQSAVSPDEDSNGDAAGAAGFAPAADDSIRLIPQAEQLKNPDARLAMHRQSGAELLSRHAAAHQGIATADYARFGRSFWELSWPGNDWAFQQSTVEETSDFAGREHVILWQDGRGELAANEAARIQGLEALGKQGVAVSQIGPLPVSRYTGELFDNNTSALIVRDPTHLPAVWCFCTSGEYQAAVRSIDQALKVTNASLVKVPFDLVRWQEIAAAMFPGGLPEPASVDPVQWLFHGHPGNASVATALQIAVARLLAYRWPPEHNSKMRLDSGARAWVERCGDLAAFADKNGIVCLPALRGELAAADRLRGLLAVAFGPNWSAAKERELLAAAAGNGGAATSLDEWLRERFFEEHCKLFHHRPFVWHIWDGRRDGFQALVSYHFLAGPNGEARRSLEALTYSYLGDWIQRQKAEQREGREGADARLAAAQDLHVQLERILAGEPPCDLFVRWKPLHLQPIGWEPDINDGVRVNIRPFLSAELRAGGRKGAGILRWKPNIKWEKDRGKEPQSIRPKEDFPWFWNCDGAGSVGERTDFMGGPEFDGNRWNDLHYANAAKRAARERAAKGARA